MLKVPTSLEGMYLLDKKPMQGATSGSLMIHNNFANRMVLYRR